MSDNHERFISDADEELSRIRQKKLMDLRGLKERKSEMSSGPVHVTDATFNDVVSKHALALVDFWASWCGPCQALGPVIEELAKEHTGQVFVGKLNVDENPETAERFQVYSIPTVLVMKNGCEVDRIVGLVPKKHIEAAIKKHQG